ncbi:MAG: electron transport complex subunit RsxC [Oscillospiraceae bacterium]|nr:electron transport complex subunit RsxC [Oscillospiraceae bacterium]
MILNSVKLPHFASAAESLTEILDSPEKVIIAMSQHIGAPCEPVVKVGDYVKSGQLIADSDAFISAPIHASVTGKVVAETVVTYLNGRSCKALVIETDKYQDISDDIKPPVINDREEFIKAVRDSGSVGLGGAGFPTHVKISYDREKTPVDTLVVNGAECEPYITSDYREFIESSDEIVNGIKLLMKYLDIPNAVVGIESDKPKAIAEIKRQLQGESGIRVKSLRARYPKGAEKVLVYETTKRVIMEGDLPSSVGCLVLNSSTVSFISRYVKTGMPLFWRRLTLDGDIVDKPKNIVVPVGTTLKELLDFASVTEPPEKAVFGGPMMGSAVYDLQIPITKTNNAILVFGKQKQHKQTACIRCGKCTYVCSMNLLPTALEHAYDARDADDLKRHRVNTCMSCGACSFVCPAKRDIAEKNHLAKQFLIAVANKKY